MVSPCYAQDSLRLPPDSLEREVFVGYDYNIIDVYIAGNYSPWDKRSKTHYGAIELGIAKTNLITGSAPVSGTQYFGMELGLRGDRFIHGTKVGVWGSGLLFALGLELAHHTDYSRHAFHLSPTMGMGIYPFKVSISPRIRLTGKSFQPINKLQISIFRRLFGIKEERKEIRRRL